ncbi:MAG: PASTA domain-containing protein [Deltaproteobacteria bacterium]|nr:PASTA domain-containing protein [Deltaproteobacteria bacterium]
MKKTILFPVMLLTIFAASYVCAQPILPNVVGKDMSWAQQELRKLGYPVRISYAYGPKRESHLKVVAQGPPGGRKVPTTVVVGLTVYQYKPPYPILPNVVGQDFNEAGKTLSMRGYRVKYFYHQTPNQELNNKVRDQIPRGGQGVPQTQIITLNVWQYKAGSSDQVTVPGVAGLHLVNALDRLNKARLRYQLVGVKEPTDPKQQGTVFSQDPAAGASVSTGSVIKMVMFRDSLPVPNVVGMRFDQALKAIEQAGYKPPQFNPAAIRTPANIYIKVVSQNPPAGQKLPYGSVVSFDIKNFSKMPNVTGISYEQAKAAITALGGAAVSAIEITYTPTSNPSQRNKVYEQYPLPGAEVDRGFGPIYSFPRPKLKVYKP